MIVWAPFTTGQVAHAWDTNRYQSGSAWRQAVCGKWKRIDQIDKHARSQKRCKTCQRILAKHNTQW